MLDDPSMPRNPVYRVRRGPDPLTLRLLLIAGGLTGALALIVVAWSSIGHRAGGPVPVVQADSRPVRVKPANPGGMQIPGLGTDTGSGDASASADKLAPAPETPDPQGLASQMRAATSAPPSGARTQPTATAQAASAPATATPRPPAAKPVAMALAPVAQEHRAGPLGAHGPVGRAQVQLAAVGTEAAARQQWDRLAHRMPSVLGAHHPLISKVEHDGHTLWRVRTGDFTTEAEANQFCQQVRANGAGCAVAAF
jgi:hypothetical protein